MPAKLSQLPDARSPSTARSLAAKTDLISSWVASAAEGLLYIPVDTKEESSYLRQQEAAISPGAYAPSTRHGARAHVVKQWGKALWDCWRGELIGCFARAQTIAELKARRVRLNRAEEKVASQFNRKYGKEIVYQRAVDEAAQRDPRLAAVVTARTAYLLAAAEGIADLPRDEDDLRRAEDRWARRWSEKLQRIRREIQAGRTSTSGATSSG